MLPQLWPIIAQPVPSIANVQATLDHEKHRVSMKKQHGRLCANDGELGSENQNTYDTLILV